MNTGLCRGQSLQEDLPFRLLSKILGGKSASPKLTLVCVVSEETYELRAQGFLVSAHSSFLPAWALAQNSIFGVPQPPW